MRNASMNVLLPSSLLNKYTPGNTISNCSAHMMVCRAAPTAYILIIFTVNYISRKASFPGGYTYGRFGMG